MLRLRSLLIAAVLLCAAGARAQTGPWPDAGGMIPPNPADPASLPRVTGKAADPALVRWDILVLIYPNLDATYQDNHWQSTMTEPRVAKLQQAAQNYQALISAWSSRAVSANVTIKRIDRPITAVRPNGDNSYWVTQDDIAADLEAEFATANYDSVMVLWNGNPVPTTYWGLAWVGAINFRGRSITYGTVVYLEDWLWQGTYPGEVIIHEWLHGVEGFYRRFGYKVPELHSSEAHGYKADANGAWGRWYSDFMQGKVLENNGQETHGVSKAVWSAGRPRKTATNLPAQLLAPLPGRTQPTPPVLKWALLPGYTFTVRTRDTADNSLIHTITTGSGSAMLPERALHTGRGYIWSVGARKNGVESPREEEFRFAYTGPEAPFTVDEAADALRGATGMMALNSVDMGRFNLGNTGDSAGQLDMGDVVRILRKAMSLDVNP